MLPYPAETVGSALRAMLPTLATVTTQLLMASTAIKVSSYMFFLDFFSALTKPSHSNWHHLQQYKADLDI